MTDQQGSDSGILNTAEISKSMTEMAETSQRLISEFLARQMPGGKATGSGSGDESNEGSFNPDPLNIGGAFMELTSHMMSDPAKMMEANMALWQDYTKLWQNAATRMMSGEAEPMITPEPGDRRFKHDSWNKKMSSIPSRRTDRRRRKKDGRKGLSGRPSHGYHVQHDAPQRPDLVVRGQ